MSDEAICLITSLLSEHAIAADLAAMDARKRYSEEPSSDEICRGCVDAMLASMVANRVRDEFFDFLSKEAGHVRHRSQPQGR